MKVKRSMTVSDLMLVQDAIGNLEESSQSSGNVPTPTKALSSRKSSDGEKAFFIEVRSESEGHVWKVAFVVISSSELCSTA